MTGKDEESIFGPEGGVFDREVSEEERAPLRAANVSPLAHAMMRLEVPGLTLCPLSAVLVPCVTALTHEDASKKLQGLLEMCEQRRAAQFEETLTYSDPLPPGEVVLVNVSDDEKIVSVLPVVTQTLSEEQYRRIQKQVIEEMRALQLNTPLWGGF